VEAFCFGPNAQALEQGWSYTDEAALFERLGWPVRVDRRSGFQPSKESPTPIRLSNVACRGPGPSGRFRKSGCSGPCSHQAGPTRPQAAAPVALGMAHRQPAHQPGCQKVLAVRSRKHRASS